MRIEFPNGDKFDGVPTFCRHLHKLYQVILNEN